MMYHFCKEDRRLGYGDGRLIEVGQTLTVNCEPVLCERGLHASKRLIDALRYAPGPILCKVKLGGTVIHGDDKSVATERTTIAIADVSEVLREFARKCALDVIHLWDAPEVVVRHLKTGDESMRDAAWAAAGASAGAAWDAAWAAAGASAGAAAWAAAGASAGAAWDAAWAAAGASAGAAWAAAREKQNRRLTAMMHKAQWESSRE